MEVDSILRQRAVTSVTISDSVELVDLLRLQGRCIHVLRAAADAVAKMQQMLRQEQEEENQKKKKKRPVTTVFREKVTLEIHICSDGSSGVSRFNVAERTIKISLSSKDDFMDASASPQPNMVAEALTAE